MEKAQKQKKNFLKLPCVLLAKLIKQVKRASELKLSKLNKVMITLFGMTLSVFVYTFIMGLQFAVGFVLMMFIHEMGHIMALRQKGRSVSAPIFIPLLGAFVLYRGLADLKDEAYVRYGGPLLGGVGALVAFILWAILPAHYPLLLIVGCGTAFFNLFNLIPFWIMDGRGVIRVVMNKETATAIRLKWLGLYLALVVGLVLLTVIQARYLASALSHYTQ